MHPQPSLKHSSFFFFILFFQVSIAQQNETPKDQTLNQQYNTLIEKSETFNDYKVLKKNKLNAFWKTVSDSVSLADKSKREALATINVKKAQIEELNSVIKTKDEELATGEEEKSNISVAGIQVNKSSYAVISVILPVALLGVIGFLIVRIRMYHQTTSTAQKELKTMENECNDYKKRALDTQIKLNRELQTERNKLLELSH